MRFQLRSHDVSLAGWLAASMSGLVVLTALVVHVAAAEEMRDMLGFGFGGIDRTFGDAAAIFFNNARLVGAVLLACFVAQVARPRPGSNALELFLLRLFVGICDGLLVLGVAFHVFYVGAALGAYGGRTVGALLPHGPLEVGAASLALALYVAARRDRIQTSRIATGAVAAIGALAVGALLEVFAG